MATNDKKISNLVSRQLPEFIQSQSPALLEFVKQYYTFLESAQITVNNVGAIDQILLEDEVTSFLQLDASDEFGNDEGDYVIDESSAKGEFIKGETITGATSGQTAVILAEDVDNGKIYTSSNTSFITGETITGSTSGGTATIVKYRANPAETITNLLEYIDIDDSLDDFFLRFKNKFLETLPNSFDASLDKKLFTKRINDLYNAKGSINANKIFFQALFNDTPEIYYPNRDMLRVSDGDWVVDTIMKVTLVSPSGGNTANLAGQTITQQTVVGNTVIGEATAVVDTVTKERISGQEVTTLIIQPGSVVGTFVASPGDNIELEDDSGDIIQEDSSGLDLQEQVLIKGTDNTNSEVVITCAVESVINNATVTSGGRYYSVGDVLSVSGTEGGLRGSVIVDTVRSDKVDSIFVETGGSGYAVGDAIVVDNTGVDGDGLAGTVSVVNGGFTLEQDLDEDGILLLETGKTIVMEPQTNSNTNDIARINISNNGAGYTGLPTITISSSAGSSGAVFPVSANIGKITRAKIFDHGFRYEVPPTISANLHMQIHSLSDSFDVGETVSASSSYNLILETTDDRDIVVMENGDQTLLEDSLQDSDGSATVVSFNASTNILELKDVSNAFVAGETITGGTSGTTAKILNSDHASLTSTVGTVVNTSGGFTTVDSHVSEITKKIQDSLYYQDYSYVVKVGEAIVSWRDELKRSIHPAGFEVFGEVAIRSQVNAKLKTGFVRVSGVVDPDEVIEILTLIFDEKVRRKLGTATDGSSLRTNPERSIEASASHTANTRDTTLTTDYTLKLAGDRETTVQGINVRQGFIYSGPRFRTLNKFAQSAFIQSNTDSAGFVLENSFQIGMYNQIRVSGTGKTPPNGTVPTFGDYNSDLRTNICIPSEVLQVRSGPGDTFDETVTTFDNTSVTFDVG